MENDYKNIIKLKKSEANSLMTKNQLKDCNLTIHTATAAAAASGVIPIPGADAVPISAAQITMVLALGKIFNQKVSETSAKGIVAAAASTFVGRNLVKLIPIVGLGVSAVVAAGVTEAIGWTIAVDFANDYKKEDVLPMEKRKYEDEELRKAREAYGKACEEPGELDEVPNDAVNEGIIVEEQPVQAEEKKMQSDTIELEPEVHEEESKNKPELEKKNDEYDLDDESISSDFSKLFGEDEWV